MLVSLLALLLSGQQPGPVRQAPPPAQDEEVLVTGQRPPTVEEARRQVNAITRTQDGQLPRFLSQVCPTVIGMNERAAAVVIARIREVASQANIETAGPGCRPNMALVITPDGRRFVRELRRGRPELFAGMEARDVRHLLESREPVRAWTVAEVWNEDGFAISPGRGGGVGVLQSRTSSILDEPTQYATLQSVVVIEDAAANGKSLGQLADYALMRTIAGARPPASDAQRSTILSLFSGSDAPPALTAMDTAYLGALYRSNPLRRSMMQMNEMSRRISSELTGTGEEQRRRR